MTITLNALQKQRRDTASNWTSNNTVLLAGELGYESDTKKFKIGDGSTAWQSLDYIPIPDTNRLLTGNLTVGGNFTVNGTTTTIDTTTLTVEDKNIEIGKVSSPSDTTADGGGISLLGTTTKTINWVDSTDSWTLSEHLDLASGKVFKINSTEILSATGLGSTVVSSSLTSVGTIATGVWNATAISGSKVTPDFGSQNIITTGGLTVDTNTLHVDSSNNRVGIGTTSPSRILQIKSAGNNATQIGLIDVDSTNEVFRVGQQSDGDGFLQLLDDAGAVQIGLEATGDSYFVGGKVGIGTTSPERVLHIQASTTKTNSIEHVLQLNHISSGTTTTGFGTGIRFAGERNNGVLQVIGDLNLEADVNSGSNISCAMVFKPSVAGVATERMRIASDGKVGIGTSSPAQKLVVSAGSDNSDVAVFTGGSVSRGLKITTSATSNTNDSVVTFNAQTASHGTLAFAVASGNEAMRIDSSGRVGIGLTPSSDTGYMLQLGSGGTQTFMTFATSGSGVGALNGLVVGNDTSRAYFTQRENQPIYIKTNNTTRVVIDENGNCGIGTTSPSVPSGTALEIKGSSASRLKLSNDTTGTGSTDGFQIYTSGNVAILENKENAEMRFYTNASEAMRIDSSRRVGIGVTSLVAQFNVHTNAATRVPVDINDTNNTSTLTHRLRFLTGGTEVGRIRSSSSATVYDTSASDITLKKNFEDWTENTLDLFKNINPQKFNYIQEEDTAEKSKGFIAQEMVDSFPEAYTKEDKEDSKYFFNPSGMVVYLMKAIQELEAKVAALEAA